MAVRTKKNRVNPLNWKVPIVSKDGTPTPEFMQKWTQQATTNAGVPDLTTAAALSALLDTLGFAQGDILYRDATLWKVLAPSTAGFILKTAGAAANPAWESVSSALDTIGTTQGNILYRNGTVWTVLAPGTDGQLLSYDIATAAPKWSSIAGVLLGSGAPASVQPAGTLYSRTDTAGVYSSQPILNAPVIVQSKYLDNDGTHNGVTFTSAVTAGNLLVVFLSDKSITPATAAAGWTRQATVIDAVGVSYMAVYTRTAQVSDGTAPPNVVTGGPGLASNYVSFELSGTSWASLDGSVVSGAVTTPGATTVMSSFTPSVATDLVLAAVTNFKASAAAQPSIGTPFTLDRQGAGARDAVWAGHDSAPASGTPIAATITWGASSTTGVYMQFGLNGTSFTANWVLVGPAPLASSSVFGLAKVDNTSIKATAGVINATTALVGDVSGGNATAGNIGELLHAEVLTSSPVSIGTATYTNICTITLTPGDWLVWGNFEGNPSVSCTLMVSSINNVSATPTDHAFNLLISSTINFGTSAGALASRRFSVAVNTQLWLIGRIDFTSGTATASGFISALRTR